MPTPRTFVAGAVVDGKLYVIGGQSQAFAESGIVEVYDPATDTWSSGSAMPTPRQLLSAGVLNGKIYVAGGQTATNNALDTVEVYDPSTDSWTSSTSMLTARNGLATAVVGSTLYAIGGADIPGNLLASVESFTAIPAPLVVTIKIKRGSATHLLNLKPKEVISVAVLTTTDFDARRIDVATVCFGDAEVPSERDCSEAHNRAHVKDVDRDGDADVVLHFEKRETGIDGSDTQACLDGRTFDGVAIEGCDSLTPAKPSLWDRLSDIYH